MKKTYIEPTIEVVTCQLHQPMLSGSASLPLSDGDTDVQLSRDVNLADYTEPDFDVEDYEHQ